MDTLRGSFGGLDAHAGDEPFDDEIVEPAPPPEIGTDERRMQVRAYNFWAGLLNDRSFPAIEDLDPEQLPDFGPHGVLLDFSEGIENPAVAFLGEQLAKECGAEGAVITSLADVPTRSLLSRITDHYMQILANQAPIGFEAEFVNQRGATILYRGILLPFSSDDETIDFIFGVINWKEMADSQTADELLLEIDQSIEQSHDDVRPPRAPLEVPAARNRNPVTGLVADDLPVPSFGLLADDEDTGAEDEVADDLPTPSLTAAMIPATPAARQPVVPEMLAMEMDLDLGAFETLGSDQGHDGLADLPLTDGATIDEDLADEDMTDEDMTDEDMGLADLLADARELAQEARSTEDRTRKALYAAIGRAHDFALAAAAEPEEFAEMVADAGLTMQERAPMTPVVKLVFGADYDKTRLTEYAAALTHARRQGLGAGELAAYLRQADGGLKGVVALERQLRREESGRAKAPAATGPRKAVARKLRAMQAVDFAAIAPEGDEFALVMVRRDGHGAVEVLGEVPGDPAMVERAARKLLG